MMFPAVISATISVYLLSESCMKYPGDHAARMKYWANVWENIPASYRNSFIAIFLKNLPTFNDKS